MISSRGSTSQRSNEKKSLGIHRSTAFNPVSIDSIEHSGNKGAANRHVEKRKTSLSSNLTAELKPFN